MSKENKWIVLMVIAFAAGIAAGGVYCALTGDNSEIYEFLHSFILNMKNEHGSFALIKKKLFEGAAILTLFLICRGIGFGYIFILLISAAESFCIGFTFAAFFKYFGQNGILMILSQLPSNIVLFITIVFFGTVCAAGKTKSDAVELAICTVMAMVGIGISAVLSGYIDTYILNFIAVKLY